MTLNGIIQYSWIQDKKDGEVINNIISLVRGMAWWSLLGLYSNVPQKKIKKISASNPPA
jgi:hypothetical protein